MTVTPLAIEPLEKPPNATVVLPGSKSITNRALVTAALAMGTTRLKAALFADDTWAMIDCLNALGISCVPNENDASITVHGCGANFTVPATSTVPDAPDAPVMHDATAVVPDAPVAPNTPAVPNAPVLNARRSGTTSRFVMALAALRTQPTVIDGDHQLRARPMGHQIKALRELGVTVDELEMPGRLPVRVHGPISAQSCQIQGDVSSQFASGLLLASGAMRQQQLTVELAAEPISWPYLKMTTEVMRAFAANVEISEPSSNGTGRTITVGGGYRSPSTYVIEADASAAAYFLAAAAITGGRVRIAGLGRASIQGDVAFAEVLSQMGASVKMQANSIEICGGELRGVDVDLRDISDTAPTLAVVAAFASGVTRVSGIGFVRHKESDRVAGSVAELRRCGVDATETADGFEVRPLGLPYAATFETYQDHRMAMAFALVGLRVAGVKVRDPGCVAKTFPGYFGALEQLR